MDLIVLTFVAGFATATLIFWPLLQKAQRDAAPQPAIGRTPKHRRTAQSSPVVVPKQPAPADEAKPAEKTEKTEAKSGEPVISIAFVPEPERVDMPELPTDLYSQRYEARFNRARKRLERLRAQINEQ